MWKDCNFGAEFEKIENKKFIDWTPMIGLQWLEQRIKKIKMVKSSDYKIYGRNWKREKKASSKFLRLLN